MPIGTPYGILAFLASILIVFMCIVSYCFVKCLVRLFPIEYDRNDDDSYDIVEVPSNDTSANLMAIEEELSIDPSVECSICLCDKTDLILPCSHMFHAKCLEEWFHHNTTCPLCRYDCAILFDEN